MLSRREFLKLSALAGAGLALPIRKLDRWAPFRSPSNAFSQSDALKKFIQPLRIVGADIPIAQPDKVNPGWWQPGVTHYTIDVGQYEDLLHPDLPNATRLRGFGQNGNFKHLGGVIAAKRGEPVQVTFRNNLPLPHILPVDRTIMGAEEPRLDNRVDVHLHGGYVPWISDGGPFAWWTPSGKRGPSFASQFLKPKLGKNEAEYYYPNQQSARLMWYHDHVLGLTRLNAYAGIATGYVIYDDYEVMLTKAPYNLPGPLDPRTVYLVFQDKIFVSQDTVANDPGWFNIVPGSRLGDLWYAHDYDRWDIGPVGTPPAVSCIPEFFGDTMLVNGTVYPYLEVEQRQYRFRLLNACQARFLNPRLVYAQGADFPASTEADLKTAGPAFIQIGTEGGFLPMPVMLNGSSQLRLLLAPAERADLIVDFRDVPAGSNLILFNDAPGPYPMGDDANDYSSSSSQGLGFGPDTRTLLQIRVKAGGGKGDAPISLPGKLTPTDPFMVTQNPGVATSIPKGVPVRRLTLNETFDDMGRLIQQLGTDVQSGTDIASGAPYFGLPYMDTASEVVRAGATEVWEIVNLTGDTHPIHFHLSNVQVLSRQDFAEDTYQGGAPTYTSQPQAPDRNELGWKETVRMNPEQVTRVILRFNLPNVPFKVPASPRTGGNEYVWHCHILEHEEHDMMRPLIVK